VLALSSSPLAELAIAIVAIAVLFVARTVLELRDRVTRLEGFLEDRAGFRPEGR
jgi:hypothetical protein